jgi:DNA-binding NarL/FixJ family response regulator
MVAPARFREQGIATPFLVISLELDPEMIEQSLASGANGVMGKDEIDTLLVESLLTAIETDHAGGQYFPEP